MIDWKNLELSSERNPTRPIHEIEADLIRMIEPKFHQQIWTLIQEIKDSAWESGAEESMSWQEAFKQPYAQ